MSGLSVEQKQELHGLLLSLKADMAELLTSSSSSSQIVDLDQPIGRLSRVSALQQQAMAQAGRNSLNKRMQLVESALQAFNLERYGECRLCQEPIAYRRLKVHPESPFCLDCQTQTERNR